jgi:hypothetical protein
MNEILENANIEFNVRTEKIWEKYSFTEKIEGVDMTTLKIPNSDDYDELLDFFNGACATFILEFEKLQFIEKYGSWNKAIVLEELNRINDWISKAEQGSVSNAFSNPNFSNEQEEYLRFRNDYYKEQAFTKEQLYQTSTLAKVYGRYFLFKDYLSTMFEKNEVVLIADSYLSFMKGNHPISKNRIMTDKDYLAMTVGLDYYIKNKVCPDMLNPVNVDLPKKVIAFTFKFIYRKEVSKSWQYEFFKFMKSMFKVFDDKNMDEDTFRKSDLYNNYSKYDSSLDEYLGELKDTYQAQR